MLNEPRLQISITPNIDSLLDDDIAHIYTALLSFTERQESLMDRELALKPGLLGFKPCPGQFSSR